MKTCTIRELEPGKIFTRDGGETFAMRAQTFSWDSQATCISIETGQIYYLSFDTDVQPADVVLCAR